MLHPISALSIERFLDSDVCHRRIRRATVPVFLSRLEPDDVAGMAFLDGSAPTLNPSASRGYDERLSKRVAVPGGSRPRFEGDGIAGRPRRPVHREQRLNTNDAGEPFRSTLSRRLRADPLDVHHSSALESR